MGAAIEDGDKLAYLERDVVISPVGMARHADQAHAATRNGGACIYILKIYMTPAENSNCFPRLLCIFYPL